MKFVKALFFAGLISFILTACISEWDKALETHTVEYQITDASEYFNKKSFDFEIELYKNELSILMDIKIPVDFQFPLDSAGVNELTYTSFKFDFMKDGKAIVTDKYLLDEYPQSIIDETGTVSFRSTLLDIRQHKKVRLDIPMYIFHNIKSGDQKFQLYVYQEYFQNLEAYNYETETYDELTKVYETKLWGMIEFEVKMPKVYMTELFSDSIILRDDETFSPRGMDFSFREGYPDIYWLLSYPLKGNNKRSSTYFKSSEANYSVAYAYQDTVKLYHYGEKNNEIRIGVYDRDDLSKDDIIGTWEGTVNELRNDRQYNTLKFDNVAKFYIKAREKDIKVN